jgi:deferrochelatase/peroxidase EfeB
LSAHGYEALGISDLPTDEAFKQGMAGRRRLTNNMPSLNDPPRWQWDEGYQENIDAMLLLADSDEQTLPRPQPFQALAVELGLYEAARICAIEYGRVRRNARNQSIEHFGYVDGRSQPLFFTKHIQEEEKNTIKQRKL